MTDDTSPDPLTELEPHQRAALERFEGETKEAVSQLGAPQPDDAQLLGSLVEATEAASAATGAAAAGSTGIGFGVGIGLAAVTIVGGALWLLSTSEPSPDATPVVVPAPEPADEPVLSPPSATSPPAPPIPKSKPPASAAPETKPADRPAPPPAAAAPLQPETPTETEPKTTAQELLRQAKEARKSGDFTLARNKLLRLEREFPGHREANTAKVSLGKLELSHFGRPKVALGHFDAYLKAVPRGNLAEEALYGRVTALRRLGRHDEERAAWRQLLERFPDSIHADEARERLEDRARP